MQPWFLRKWVTLQQINKQKRSSSIFLRQQGKCPSSKFVRQNEGLPWIGNHLDRHDKITSDLILSLHVGFVRNRRHRSTANQAGFARQNAASECLRKKLVRKDSLADWLRLRFVVRSLKACR